MSSVSSERLNRYALTPARKRRDRIARGAVLAGTVLALIPLAVDRLLPAEQGPVLVELELLHDRPHRQHLLQELHHRRRTERDHRHDRDRRARLGCSSIPIGIGVAVWLVEYGRSSWFANTVRFFVDVLTGVPSIIFGLFIYIALIIGTGSSYAGYKGSLALALLMLPVVIRSAEVVLLLVPGALRESALALGAPRFRVIGSIVLPTALPGMVTGVLLAIARAAGETAPLLFTAGATFKTSTNLGGFMNSLPVQIYNDVTSPTSAVVDRAWGAALALVVDDPHTQPDSPTRRAKESPCMSTPPPNTDNGLSPALRSAELPTPAATQTPTPRPATMDPDELAEPSQARAPEPTRPEVSAGEPARRARSSPVWPCACKTCAPSTARPNRSRAWTSSSAPTR